MHRLTTTLLALLAASACAGGSPRPTTAAAGDRPKPSFRRVTRPDFNQRAQERLLPLFWRSDANQDGALDPEELVVIWGPQHAFRKEFVDAAGAFTPAFVAAYEGLLGAPPEEATALSPEELRRRAKVLEELAQGKPTLVEADLAKATDQERAFMEAMSRAAVLVERLYARQLGSLSLAEKAGPDAPSRALFFRNQGPWCVAPKTEKDPDCSAHPERPPRLSGLYPVELQAKPAFCEALAKEKNAKALVDHFSVVVADGAALKAVPYQEAYPEDMEAVAKELEQAAAALKDQNEPALVAYLLAAAGSFHSNDWEPANEAWAAMNATNSKWYLRVAPDEVYYEPCALKAGFALNLSRINPDSLAWQQKLEPVKADMEKALAALAGPPYKARDVQFKLPDFIDVVLVAGDQRSPHGGTLGQSLPNWGAVAARGGRTVTMTNLYTDADSQATLRGQMASLFCAQTMTLATTDAKPSLMSVVLHEAAHNLGPSHEYKVKGKNDDAIFGGPLAAMMEELKAQTAALYLTNWLVGKTILTQTESDQSNVRDVAWAFGHISRGMYDAGGKPRTYSQLASVQLGTLFEAGALAWKPEEKAANGTDVGCFEIDLAKWRPTVDALAARVFKAKAKGDKKDAEKMKATYVDGEGEWKKASEIITERWLRVPKATFIYGVPL